MVLVLWSGAARASDGLAPIAASSASTQPVGVSPHVLQTIGASGLTLTLGVGWYLADKRNVLDWDKPSLESRLTGASWRYDNNNFGMNFILHPLFGASSYTFARDSHFGVVGSFLTSFTTSMMWEFVIEYNERVSINDVITTPVAGVALGEFAHKLGYYVSSYRKPDGKRAALRWTLSPTTQVAHLGCGDEPWRDHETDELGYTSGLWHEFAVNYGVAAFSNNQGKDGLVQRFRAGGKLVSLRGYRQPGRSANTFSDADLTELRLMVDTSASGTGVTLVSDTTLFGYAARDLSERGDGYAHAVGIAVGYQYRDTTALGLDDRLSSVGFPGVHTDLFWSRRGLSSEVGLRLYPTFGASSVPAFRRYRSLHPDAGFKTIMSREGYFYGWGGAGQLQARQNIGIVHNEVVLRAASLWSDQGRDRDQEKVTDDTKARELAASAEMRTWVDLGHSMVGGIEVATRLRESRAGDVRLKLSERSLGLWLGSVF